MYEWKVEQIHLTHYLGFIQRRPISPSFLQLFPLGLLHTIPTPVFFLYSNYFFGFAHSHVKNVMVYP